jgi:TolB-like protein/Tfp pilus assembly protein PilF/predicted Ser/Thr protein kinase
MLVMAVWAAPPVTTEPERAPESTEVSPQRHLSDSSVQPQAAAGEERATIGERLSGRYRIERELGEGGMGVVYLVADEQVAGEIFAVKVLKESLDPETLTGLREEVRKTRKLSHPNIVDVHSVNVDGTRLYVLMEYLEGKSLNALLDEEFGRGIAFSHAWPIIEDVGAALGYAHDHNVIHSDLKPANVFLTTSGKTKLLDFGIARVSRGPLLHRRSGPLALTPAYASCEMLEGEDADARDDIYSFACVIYEMLCGKRPFGDLTGLEAREAGAQVPPLALLSREQNAALTQGLAFDRKDRTASVEQFLEGLAERKPRARAPIAVLVGTITAAFAALGLIFWDLDQLWISRHSVVIQSVGPETQQVIPPAATTPDVAAFDPPPHSIAVMPFVNMSGDVSQQYFSDGLTEELLNSLSRINELQVAARTSSFSFQGEHPDIATVAHKLNVASVLEGSVRRSGHTIRVTAQLDNAVTGYHLWSQTYDRDLGDVLQLQTEIATAVATALKVRLLGDVGAKIELGGTRNPGAFDAYLRASRSFNAIHSEQDLLATIAEYTKAIQLDSHYALAFAARSLAFTDYADQYATGLAVRDGFDKARADARKAKALAAGLADGHLAAARVFQSGSLDFAKAKDEYERAVELAPGNAKVLREYGRFAVLMGRTDAGIAAARRAVVLDPLNSRSHSNLGLALYFARRYEEAIAATQPALMLNPSRTQDRAHAGLAYFALGDFQRARISCEIGPDNWQSQACLAVAYDKLGRHPEAEAALAKIKASMGDAAAYICVTIYAQWGNIPKALEWLDTAVRRRDSGLVELKTAPLNDPLRKEPRFQAIERALKFPE